MLKGQNVMLKDTVMEVMANTAKRLLKKLPTMYLYLPQLISLSRLVLFYLRKETFNFHRISEFSSLKTKMLFSENNYEKLNEINFVAHQLVSL